jgi:hypothetical protein
MAGTRLAVGGLVWLQCHGLCPWPPMAVRAWPWHRDTWPLRRALSLDGRGVDQPAPRILLGLCSGWSLDWSLLLTPTRRAS